MFLRFYHWLRDGLLYNLIRLFRIKAKSEMIARGFAVGLIVNFYPTFGFGVLISGFLARAVGGNAVAGLIGGAMLTFFWPALFFLNMKVGSWLLQRRAPVQELGEVTERAVEALVWGKTFTYGAFVNSILIGFSVYWLLRLIYSRIRPHALAYFRHHARENRRRHHSSRRAELALKKSAAIAPP